MATSILANTNLREDEVGMWGGGDKDLRPVTVITYDSAAIHTRILSQFGLLIFDEVHHLPADTYRTVAEGAIATARLGLSATPERSDLRHGDLDRLVGRVVYERLPAQLREDKHIADYRTERVSVGLTDEERVAYDRAAEVYRRYLRKYRISMRSGSDYERFLIWRSGNDPAAREALLAHQAARKIALTAAGKLDVVAELLSRHREDRVLIFSEYNSLVDTIGASFCLPTVTHKTPAPERKAILDGFRSGRFSKLATGRVLNEGVDLPDANVAIILSGSATKREFIQRLGRVLRPKVTEAVLYEVVTEDSDGGEHIKAEAVAGERRITGMKVPKPDWTPLTACWWSMCTPVMWTLISTLIYEIRGPRDELLFGYVPGWTVQAFMLDADMPTFDEMRFF